MTIPANTLRKFGIGLVSATPILVAVLDRFGVHECTPDEVAMGCVGAAAMVGAFVSLFGGAVYWYGRKRAEARESPPK